MTTRRGMPLAVGGPFRNQPISKLSINIAANALNRVWAFISAFAFTPIYIRLLGVEGYGLVGFYTALSALLVVADLGFTATLSRLLARFNAMDTTLSLRRNSVYSFEMAYAPISLLVALLVWLAAGKIASYWLQSSTLATADIQNSIQWMGVAIAAQLQMGLYYGGLMGLEKQALANGIQIACSLVRNLGAVLILWKVYPTVGAFAAWQAITSVASLIIVRSTLWRMLRPTGQVQAPVFSWLPVLESLRYTGGMAGMAVLSVILTQIDKLVVSKILPLEKLGLYTMASTYAMVPMMLATPISSAITPRMAGMIALGSAQKITDLYHRGAQLISIVVLPVSVVLLAFPEQLITLWTGRPAQADEIAPIARFLLAGQVVQAISLMPYCLTLGFGDVTLNIRFAIISVIIVLPLSPLLLIHYGMLGGGMAWLLMNILTIPLYCWFVHRRFLPDEFKKWFFGDVGKAFTVVVLLACSCRLFVRIPEGVVPSGVALSAIWVFSIFVIALTLPIVRHFIVSKIAGLRE